MNMIRIDQNILTLIPLEKKPIINNNILKCLTLQLINNKGRLLSNYFKQGKVHIN